jgi:transposase
VKRYDEAFRKDAVETLINSGEPLKRVARDLGVSTWTLRVWRNAYLAKAEPPEAGMPSVREAYNELRKLKAENRVLKRQRDILKKVLGILSEPSAGGML